MNFSRSNFQGQCFKVKFTRWIFQGQVFKLHFWRLMFEKMFPKMFSYQTEFYKIKTTVIVLSNCNLQATQAAKNISICTQPFSAIAPTAIAMTANPKFCQLCMSPYAVPKWCFWTSRLTIGQRDEASIEYDTPIVITPTHGVIGMKAKTKWDVRHIIFASSTNDALIGV